MKKITIFCCASILGFLLISGTIVLDNLFNYANQTVPTYITEDNTSANNAMTDEIATLGRVLFYDKNLSIDNTIACASCHQQAFAFSDPATVSTGVNGVTGRHSMRLTNIRFDSDEQRVFWDRRASSIEDQALKPIQDPVEMGFSGENGQPSFNDLIVKLSALDYYQELFSFAFGDSQITQERIALAIAQFERSMQSFDSKYDVGRAQVANDLIDFPNFTPEENLGKSLFMDVSDNPFPANNRHPNCLGCHQPPNFSIINLLGNNGVITKANSTELDLTNKRSPSLRDLVNPLGELNGPLMHDGSFTSLEQVIEHYNLIETSPNNPELAIFLGRDVGGQSLELTQNEKDALVAFMKTLTSVDIYTNEKWSDPFDEFGNITILNGHSITLGVSLQGRTDYNGDYSVTLYETTDLVNPAYTFNKTISDGSGNIILNSIADGNYKVVLKRSRFLQRVVPISVASSNESVITPMLLGGNAIDDNVINISDFGIFSGNFGKSNGDENYNSAADFNGDQNVNISDFGIFSGNFGVTGETQND